MSTDRTAHPAPRRALKVRPTGAALAVGAACLAGLAGELLGVEPMGLLFGVGAGTLLLAWGLARLHVGSIEVVPPTQRHSFATVPRPLAIEVRSNAASLAARDLLVSVDDGRTGGAPVTGHLAYVGCGETAQTVVTPRFRERGRRKNLMLSVRSSFPLGLFDARLDLVLPFDHIVLPRLGRLGPLERRLARIGGRTEDAPRGAQGDGEFYGLREWRDGQSLRRVHWKLSARRGRLLLRELVSEERPTIRLVLSCFVPLGVTTARVPSFERAVSLAATLAEHFLRQGQRLELVLAGDEVTRRPAVGGRAALLALLTDLAEVRHVSGDATEAFRVVSPESRARDLFVLAGGRALANEHDLRELSPPPGAWVLDVDDASGIEVFEGMRDPRETRRAARTVLSRQALPGARAALGSQAARG